MMSLAESIDVYAQGADAADEILRDVFRVRKALDPLDAGDFMSIVRRLSRALHGVAGPAEDAALRRALERLDVDWPNLPPRARDQVIRAAREALGTVDAQVLPQVDQLFEVAAESSVRHARRSTVRRLGLRIGADTTRGDERVAKFVRESQGNFVRDEYGRRRADFSSKAKEIVAAGVERGLGRDDIVSELSSVMASQAFDRSRAYWETISMVFTNRARTYTQLGAFGEAGIERFRFDAVLDEVTSEVCRFMHGKVFTVERDGPLPPGGAGARSRHHPGRAALRTGRRRSGGQRGAVLRPERPASRGGSSRRALGRHARRGRELLARPVSGAARGGRRERAAAARSMPLDHHGGGVTWPRSSISCPKTRWRA